MPAIDRKKSKTVLPDDLSDEQVATFVRQLERFANKQTRLISSDDEEVLLPAPLFDILRRVADELANGRGVTVVPQETRLTTQESADFLGISRPTLIKLLETGAIPFELVGRHRRVLFRDLTRYQDQARAARRVLLRRAARDGQRDGAHERTTREAFAQD